jgi:hypothetical protein
MRRSPCRDTMIEAVRFARQPFQSGEKSPGKDRRSAIMSNFLSFVFMRMLVLGSALLIAAPVAVAQFEPASPPIADPADTRFQGVTEDWTTPALGSSHLKPIQPFGFFDDTNPGYTVELRQAQWRWGDPIDLYVMKPKGVKNPPVIVYLFTYPTDTDLFKNKVFQNVVTKDGFAAVCFVSALTGHRYHDRPMREWFVSELQESLAKSAHDVQMVLDYLNWRGDLDMSRVGMFGQGSGASIAILTSAVDPRIKVLDVLDPWGDWPTWMATSRFVPENERPQYVKPEFLQKVAALEPVEWLPKVQAKKFRFQDATFDIVTPKASKEKLRAAVPQGTRFVFYKTEPEFDALFQNSVNLDWMEHELRMLPETQPAVSPPLTSVSSIRK